MASGIDVASAAVDTFNDIKLSHKHRYVIYKRNADNTIIEVEQTADPSKTYDDFCAALPANECRYGIFDMEYSKSDADGIRQKIVFVVWAPDTAKIKDKMLTASSKDALKKQLIGISTEIQATDPSEIAYDYVLEKIQSISR
uniref:ADF-H domain-containing protein n=1 Tax=Vannella robusta TaxID=1487602 RepID=A0A7S4MRM4_9EUKA